MSIKSVKQTDAKSSTLQTFDFRLFKDFILCEYDHQQRSCARNVKRSEGRAVCALYAKIRGISRGKDN